MAPKAATSTTASAAQPAPGNFLPLAQLNKASVKIGGEWSVIVFRPIEDTYEYTWQSKPRQGTTFLVTLVSAQDPTQYCQGQVKKNAKNTAKYEQIKKAMEHGRRFVMSKVAFVDDAKLLYVSCPLKIVVDLFSTKMDACVDIPNSVVQPVPEATIAGSANLEGNQFFDVIALVQEVSQVTNHSNNRSSFVIKIYDGSVDPDNNKIKVMPLRVYFDTTPESVFQPKPSATVLALQPMSGNDMKALAEQHMNDKTPIALYAISGSQDDIGKFMFRNTKHTYMAGAVGPKAEKIKDAAELHNLTPDQTAVFEIQTTTGTARDWSAEPAKETRCALLATFARTATGVKELDEDESIWQSNWVRITEPASDQSPQLQLPCDSVCICVSWAGTGSGSTCRLLMCVNCVSWAGTESGIGTVHHEIADS